MSEQPAEEPQKICPMCAGTGKVRDWSTEPSLFGASTYFSIDPEKSEYNWVATFGT